MAFTQNATILKLKHVNLGIHNQSQMIIAFCDGSFHLT